MASFKDINSRNDLAVFLGLPPKKLTHLLYKKRIDNCYKSFQIPKRSGGIRTINAPDNELKSILRVLSDELLKHQQQIWEEKQISPNIAHGFAKNKSILTNAKVHINKKYVFNIDLKDFFDSFHFGRVAGYFEKNWYFTLPHDIAIILAQLTCYKGKLPQGAPTSPIITNLICQILDFRILSLAKKFRLDYTRYADDLTFSTNDKNFIIIKDSFLNELTHLIEKSGFEINESKTRLMYKDSRQTVTGLTVNKKPNIARTYYKTTKAMALSLYKNGSFLIDGQEGTIEQLQGRFAFINQIDKYSNINNKHTFRELNSREKEYRKFLFFKFFIANDLPVIITEGKTDVIYLKSALKNLYALYPNLIEKSENDSFNFKVKFFNRTDTISFLFGVSKDGADAMKNLFNFFSHNKGNKNIYPDYKTLFHEKYSLNISHPVIFLFDHELSNKNKPLYNFLNHLELKGSDKQEELETNLFTLIDEENLFLVTNPLNGNKGKDCEIEDLFFKKTLNHVISGKSFSREKNYNTDKHYGKEIFSKYIASNFKTIDFSNFKPMLDAISKIIQSK